MFDQKDNSIIYPFYTDIGVVVCSLFQVRAELEVQLDLQVQIGLFFYYW